MTGAPLDWINPLRAARAEWAATGLRKDYTSWRPNVERAVAQVATFGGRRLKLRYRKGSMYQASAVLPPSLCDPRGILALGAAIQQGFIEWAPHGGPRRTRTGPCPRARPTVRW